MLSILALGVPGTSHVHWCTPHVLIHPIWTSILPSNIWGFPWYLEGARASRHTLSPSSMVHHVQACLSYLQGDAHWYSTFTSHVFLFLTVLLVFLGHLPPLISYRSPTLTLFSVLVHSMHLLQVFGTVFLTDSIHLLYSTLSGNTWKHTLPSSF